MEGIKEFLESSTIHGLSYISTNRTLLSKLFWVAVVITGFLTAGVLIENSFSGWRNAPISTSIDTFPISKVTYPRVTVCPPLGTNTGMNYDLLTAENSTLEKGLRDDLAILAGNLLQAEEFREKWNEDNLFEEKGKYRNIYYGYSKFSLPYNGWSGHNYMMETVATSGSVKTYGFGKRLNDFNNKTMYEYKITLPSNIATIATNLSLVVEIVLDTKQTDGGTDSFYLGPPGGYETKYFEHTGNITLRRVYKVSKFTGLRNYLYLKFKRNIDQISLDQWTDKRMTGMAAKWYFEDENGDKVEVDQEHKYLREDYNEMFIRLVNIVHNAVTVKNITLEEMWKNVKEFRQEWIGVEKEKAAKEFCYTYYMEIFAKPGRQIEHEASGSAANYSNPDDRRHYRIKFRNVHLPGAVS